MFFIFSFFLKKQFLLFFFSCISFKYFLLLAIVSELNCFLRSRCSMEMWCPDDIGRLSWDWVGPPAWRRACFNSPEWGGGFSAVETEPLQVVLLLLFSTRSFRLNVICQQTLKIKCAAAFDGKETFTIEGLRDMALDSRRPGGARKTRRTAIWLRVKIMSRFSSANCAGSPGQPTR